MNASQAGVCLADQHLECPFSAMSFACRQNSMTASSHGGLCSMDQNLQQLYYLSRCSYQRLKPYVIEVEVARCVVVHAQQCHAP